MMRVVHIGLIAIGCLVTSTVQAREREWRLSPAFEYSIQRDVDSRGFGASLSLEYGFRYWLAWRLARVSWQYTTGLLDQSGQNQQQGVGALQYDLHRMHLISTVVLRPPRELQVMLRHVVPSIGMGVGFRADYQVNRWTLTPSGQQNAQQSNDSVLEPVVALHAGIDWRPLRRFALGCHVDATNKMTFSSPWNLALGASLSFAFYWN